MRLSDYDTETRFDATVVESVRITPPDADEIRHMVLEVEDPSFRFRLGQNIGVLVPGPHKFGQEVHFRLYTVASAPDETSARPRLDLCVKRCSYIDDISGERYDGVASNYLCDRRPFDEITIAGPYGLAFDLPEEEDADLLLIGLGTGIAPFRALVKHIYQDLGGWQGKVRLFYGARSGMEMAYMNDEQNDFTNYYDEETFEAFAAVSPRPHMEDPISLHGALNQNSEEVWEMLQKADTFVYVAGLEGIRQHLDGAFEEMAGSAKKWQRRKAELVAGGRWTELIY